MCYEINLDILWLGNIKAISVPLSTVSLEVAEVG